MSVCVCVCEFVFLFASVPMHAYVSAYVCVCMIDRMCMYGMVYQCCIYSLSISLSIRKMYGCETYGGYNCSGSSRKMDGIHILYRMFVRLSLYRTMPSPRQRQRQKHRNILDWWFTSYERCIHIHSCTHIRII